MHSTQTVVQPFVYNSADWQAPADFKPCRGVIVARLGRGEYAMFKYGEWRRIGREDWKANYASHVPAGLPTGWWAILPKLYYAGGSYSEPFDTKTLNRALDRAVTDLREIADKQLVA